jgi:hypothetical protein
VVGKLESSVTNRINGGNAMRFVIRKRTDRFLAAPSARDRRVNPVDMSLMALPVPCFAQETADLIVWFLQSDSSANRADGTVVLFNRPAYAETSR